MNELQHFGKPGMRWGKGKKGKTPQQMALQRRQTLKSPTKTLKNFDKISTHDLERSVTRMKLQRDLRNLSNDQRQKGAKYAQSYLAYGTTMVTAYGIYKSPLGQRIKEAITKVIENRRTITNVVGDVV